MSNRIRATAPARVADLGGWTDTWFAGSGHVCSVAVSPGAHVELQLADVAGPITLHVGSTGEQYAFSPGQGPGRHPLLEAAINRLAPTTAATIIVGADVPAGSGMGTSAAVCVALLAALGTANGLTLSPAELAAMAHGVETGLGWQSGVQDQWAAAFGGINQLCISYPDVHRQSVDIAPAVLDHLGSRLVTVYLGKPHSSSALHEEVIASITQTHPGEVFQRLRDAAAEGARTLEVGDFNGFGVAMIDNHEAVRQLHPSLVGHRSEAAISSATRCGAIGWNVNGAGGDGGSITFLGPESPTALDTMRRSLAQLKDAILLDLAYCAAGVHVTTTDVI